MIVEDAQENYLSGWIKLYRSVMHKAWYKKPNYNHLWNHLLLMARHASCETFFGGEKIVLKPGQLITGRQALARDTGIHEASVERILTYFEKIEQQIEQQKNSVSRLISILNYKEYQQPEQQNAQPLNNGRTTAEQPLNTIQELNNYKNLKKDIYPDYIQFLNGTLGKKYRGTSEKTKKHFNARIGDGYALEDFQTAIRNASKDTYHQSVNFKYLTPEFFTRADKLDNFINASEMTQQTVKRKMVY